MRHRENIRTQLGLIMVVATRDRELPELEVVLHSKYRLAFLLTSLAKLIQLDSLSYSMWERYGEDDVMTTQDESTQSH